MKTAPHSASARPRRTWLPALAAAATALALTTTHLALATVAQVPTTVPALLPVNIMYTLDDSGSMHSDSVPDVGTSFSGVGLTDADQFSLMWIKTGDTGGITSTKGFLHPDFYNQNHATANIARIARYFRSTGNPIYYNPRIRYQPWPTADNDQVRYAVATPSAVRIHGDRPLSGSPFPTVANPNSSTAYNTIDLTKQHGVGGTALGAAAAENVATNFWPATYFLYTGTTALLANGTPHTDPNNVVGNFVKKQIRFPDALNAATDFLKYTDRQDCTGATHCTAAEERQNFANWLQYYRNRYLTAKGGTAAAFSIQSTNLRVGYGAINKGSSTIDGTSTSIVKLGVRLFSGAARTEWYRQLYIESGTSSTPLRTAAIAVGEYFKRTGTGSPMNLTPGSAPLSEAACRRNFHILTTDGFWNDGDTSAGNADNWATSTVPASAAAPNPIYTLSGGAFVAHPYKDAGTGGHVGSLADVAALYWKTDLRPDLENFLKPTPRDPAFWQHLTTYTVGIGIRGTANYAAIGTTSLVAGSTAVSTGSPTYNNPQSHLDYAVQYGYNMSGSVAGNVAWPTPVAGTATTGDDLIKASVNGHGRYFLAQDPAEFATNLADALSEATNQPVEAAGVAASSSTYALGAKVFQPLFNPDNWFGKLYAFAQPTSGKLVTNPSNALWEASAALPAASSRSIFSIDPPAAVTARGIDFTWAAIGATRQGYLGVGAAGQDVLNYLRGDISKEIRSGGTLRNRQDGVLGDLVNSAPVIPFDVNAGYANLPASMGASVASGYDTYFTTGFSSALRKTVFVGANDGMTHAFNTDTGVERFAVVPDAVYNVTPELDPSKKKLKWLSNPAFTHKFLVDGSPQMYDAYLTNNVTGLDGWTTVLVQTTGAGARSIFAIDVGNPVPSTEPTWKKRILWEFSDTTAAVGAFTPANDLGYTIGHGVVGVLPDGTWAVFFGNGYNSVSGKAILYVLNLQTGAVITQFVLDAGTGNGLSTPQVVINNNRTVSRVYAGDLKGNMWRVDFPSAIASSWANPFGAAPLVTAVNDSGTAQPIVVQPAVVSDGSLSGPVILFGTGKYFEDEDADISQASNFRIQSLYGVWDNGTPVSTAINPLRNGAGAQLQRQGRIASPGGFNTGFGLTTKTTFTFGTDVSTGKKRGWFLDLVPAGVSDSVPTSPNTDPGSAPTGAALKTAGERAYIRPQLAGKLVFFGLNIPSRDQCTAGGSGSFMALDSLQGYSQDYPVFDLTGDGIFNTSDAATLSGGVKSFASEVKFGQLITTPLLQTATASSTVLSTGAVGTGGGVLLGSTTQRDCAGSAADGTILITTGTSDTQTQQNFAQACPAPVVVPQGGRTTWRQLQ